MAYLTKMADNHHLVEFEESLSKFRDYPLNLTRTADFSYTLEAYNSKLVQGDEVYFDDSQPRIRFWDLEKPQDGSCLATVIWGSDLLIILTGKHVSRSAVDLVQLQNALSETPTDPCRRFMCVQKT